MLAQSVLLLALLLAGAAAQAAGAPARLRDVLWVAFFWTFSPVLVFVTFLTVDLDEGARPGAGGGDPRQLARRSRRLRLRLRCHKGA